MWRTAGLGWQGMKSISPTLSSVRNYFINGFRPQIRTLLTSEYHRPLDKLYIRSASKCSPTPTGEIQLIVGPMFAGKSTEMLRRVRRFQHANLQCIVLKYIDDDRYESTDDSKGAADDVYISTHDKIRAMKAFPTRTLMDAKAILDVYDVVGIDEGQFFPDLIEFCEHAAALEKIVIVAALDGTFQRAPFGQVCDLVAKSESVLKLTAVCAQCGQPAPFTRRTTAATEDVLIGGSEHYMPVCRAHYHT
eukprot:m.629958 g.629958  ORF g.629958 m.629958 type:complete len:248 (+) comp22564_c0_seq1:417-1160(+)